MIDRVARQRNEINRAAGVIDQRVSEDTSLGVNQIGAAGECAVAMAFGMYPDWRKQAVQSTPKSQQPDVGRIHVRAARHGRGLIVKPNDVDGPYVLCWVSKDFRHQRIIGWRFAFEAKRDEFWRKDIPRPAFIVPHDRLYGLDSLRCYLDSFGE